MEPAANPHMSMHQLPLELTLAQDFSPQNFLLTEAILPVWTAIRDTDVLVQPQIRLLGDPGSGKTHLAHFAAARLGGVCLSADACSGLDIGQMPDGPVIVDDADRADPETLFHLINYTLANRNLLLLLSCKSLINWNLRIADLRSRLAAMRPLTLPPPDDVLLKAVLRRTFHSQAVTPSDDCLDFLVVRMHRSLTETNKIVTDLVHYANGRPFTRALARSFMDEVPPLPFGSLL